ncbi:MAG: hypothetical protein HYT87_19880 [Nitrospirae bacterium]|nr:hypothetical protein [Nitrospirota bacterium]
MEAPGGVRDRGEIVSLGIGMITDICWAPRLIFRFECDDGVRLEPEQIDRLIECHDDDPLICVNDSLIGACRGPSLTIDHARRLVIDTFSAGPEPVYVFRVDNGNPRIGRLLRAHKDGERVALSMVFGFDRILSDAYCASETLLGYGASEDALNSEVEE